MGFPKVRMRRLRRTPQLRAMMRETALSPSDLVMPLFVRHGEGVRREISSMPGNFQLSVDELVVEAHKIRSLGIPSIILFGIPAEKDAKATEAWDDAGIVQRALRSIKREVPDLVVMADLCLCEYTDHGHCGVVLKGHDAPGRETFSIDNDQTLGILARAAVAQARAGADMIAPSDMMDGRVGAVRTALDEAGFSHLPIFSYAAKYASSFYGPFREAAESPPAFGDRRSHQMDPANADEALREVELDLDEGADIVMVKPALPYLDIIRRVKDRFACPVGAYNVSGEFAMIKAAARLGWLDEKAAALESLLSIRRAGADIILTYWAVDAVRWLDEPGPGGAL
jgi:porphobilinogen synthase